MTDSTLSVTGDVFLKASRKINSKKRKSDKDCEDVLNNKETRHVEQPDIKKKAMADILDKKHGTKKTQPVLLSTGDNVFEKKGSQKKKKSKKVELDKTLASNAESLLVSNTLNTSDSDNGKKNLKRKKQKTIQVEVDSSNQSVKLEDKQAEKAALDYLRKWKSNKDEWNFQKVRQVWLLRNMYDVTKVSDEDFQVLLAYLDGLKGHSRTLTIEQAEKLVDSNDDLAEELDNKDSAMKLSRAREIIQLLVE